MAFLDLVATLTGELPGLPPQLARKHINWAWRDIRQRKLWSFLNLDAALVCPEQVIAGTASITQYSDSVTLDATASAALLAQTLVGAVPGIQNLSIRFGTTSPVQGQVYNILDADTAVPAAIVLTLNRVVLEATAATSSYQCYRAYVVPPLPDFLAWQSLNDMANAFSMTHENGRLAYSSTYFDMRDPQRQAQGLAYFLGAYAGAYLSDPTTNTVVPLATVDPGVNIYELWPHPTSGQTFYVRFRRRGTDFVQPSETQPAVITDAMILARAKAEYSYPFAQANVGHFPTFRNVSWSSLIQGAKATYLEAMTLAKKNDEEAALSNVFSRGHGLRRGRWDFKGVGQFPIDSNYMQSHLVRI